ncbi:MAG: translation initiation factor IF-2 [Candidatus Pacebacteria bacterium]|nr:translation initiation factor IF-2 [Candidatus Paceibacterota bacterium]
MPNNTSKAGTRPPIVAVVGHIDHGKSTLLDYIRSTNVVDGEAGGITQHLSAYQAVHENAQGRHAITFLDTPGHAAFVGMRSRGLEVADVAILVVSAEEGIKPQTVEALDLIKSAEIPYVIAFTKIDKPGANLERAKLSMLEHQVFIEGMGGDVPWVGVSSKSGEGIPELLDLILLAAELEDIKADASLPGRGLIIEAHTESKRGNTAMLIVLDGTVVSGKYVVAGECTAPVRIMENFKGLPIKEAGPSSPIRIVGFSPLPTVGTQFEVVANKKEAEAKATAFKSSAQRSALKGASPSVTPESPDTALANQLVTIPLIIKTDVAGTGEAVVHELAKLPRHDNLEVRVVARGVGAITESDIKMLAGSSTPGLVVGFNVKIESAARELAERQGVTVNTFDIIYKLTEWLSEIIEERRPRAQVEEIKGAAKVLKFFSAQSGRVVLGGRVEEGALSEGTEVRLMRRDEEIGRGKIVSLQTGKTQTKKVEAGVEFGAMLKTEVLVAAGDRIEAVAIVIK